MQIKQMPLSDDEEWVPGGGNASSKQPKPKRKALATPAPPPSKRQQTVTPHDDPLTHAILSSMMMSGGFPFRMMSSNRGAVRGAKLQASRKATQDAAASWAANRSSQPYVLSDLVHTDESRASLAREWYQKLKLTDMKSESALHGLSVSGSKSKQFDALFDKALDLKYSPKPAVGSVPNTNATAVRRSLAADLRSGFVYDKKLKKGNKMLKAFSFGVGPGVFETLFPQVKQLKGKKAFGPIAISETDLGMNELVKTLRYGSMLALVPGTLKAKLDGSTIVVTAKICMHR